MCEKPGTCRLTQDVHLLSFEGHTVTETGVQPFILCRDVGEANVQAILGMMDKFIPLVFQTWQKTKVGMEELFQAPSSKGCIGGCCILARELLSGEMLAAHTQGSLAWDLNCRGILADINDPHGWAVA